ncbi:MAG: pyridoxine 5'-phosphate synthase [Blastochloris sp.]|nr:pyridoxine 5'-phosphate synthase [Blastochloris sp.]
MLKLGVNIDHIATLRQARYRELGPDHPLSEPCPVQAAHQAVAAGAHSITAHLREDRRHIQDHDVLRLKRELQVPLNLEMALTPEMLHFALKLEPAEVCLVPENRLEVSTEGGLNLPPLIEAIRQANLDLSKNGTRVSLFIDPVEEQIHAAHACGVPCIELHTGCFANALDTKTQEEELERLRKSASLAFQLGLQVNAGHGLHYRNLRLFLQTPHLDTLNIGHSLIAHACEVGLREAVGEMLSLMRDGHHGKSEE